ncbi:hypothetical protein B0H17DRAFT_1201662 [Mycena rosella]|uniref:Uncharacterized protein n=1 Tax=Mycena rosella TaxID=1033263 RepID=A0AAD7DGN9_MYCRO|nr:hypothetical protein B0H17DRAFT_1201662 [Mycena rosella]
MANGSSHDSITASANATTFASRNPGKPVQEARGRKKREPLSNAQKEERRQRQAKATMRAEDLQAAVDAFCAQHADTIVLLAKKHDKEIDYIRSLLLNETGFKASREVSLYGAVMHHLKQEGNIEVPDSGDEQYEGMDRQTVKNRKRAAVLIELHRLTKDAIEEGLAPEEEKEMMAALRAAHELKHMGLRASNIAAATDTRAVANRIQDELIALFQRTGTWGFCLMTRGHSDDTALPTFLHLGEAKAFVIEMLKKAPLDLLRIFEQWSCARSAASVQRDNRSSLCMQISQLVEEALRAITGNDDVRIDYVNMDVAIREMWGIEISGWPADIGMVAPSKVKNVEPLRTLHDGWVSGRICWVKLTPEQVVELTDVLVALRAANGGIVKRCKERSDKDGKHAKAGPRAVGKARKVKEWGKGVAKSTSKRKGRKGRADEYEDKEEEEEEEEEGSASDGDEDEEEEGDEEDDKPPPRRKPMPCASARPTTTSTFPAAAAASALTTSTSTSAAAAAMPVLTTTSTCAATSAALTSADPIFIQYVPPGPCGALADATNRKRKATEAEGTGAAKKHKTVAAPKPKPAAAATHHLPGSGYKTKKTAASKAPCSDATTKSAMRAMAERASVRASAALAAQVPPHA